ncbi:MAG: ribbon-helix-helix domain-containing protein [Candidatus Helarchaeota archaeon]
MNENRKIRYTTFKIPEELANQLDEFIKNNPELGYRNRTELITFILRNFIINNKNKIKE